MMRFNRSSASITGRPKSKGREALDAILFLGAAGVVGWSGLGNLENGRVEGRYGISMAEQPGLFWTVQVVHLLIVVGCLGIGAMSLRALLKSGAGAGSQA